MADVEVIIKIPEEDWKSLKESDGCRWSRAIIEGVINGTPLPKGHGDLKDANKLKYAFISWSMAIQGNFTDADIASIVCNSPTIVEADTAESEEEPNQIAYDVGGHTYGVIGGDEIMKKFEG